MALLHTRERITAQGNARFAGIEISLVPGISCSGPERGPVSVGNRPLALCREAPCIAQVFCIPFSYATDSWVYLGCWFKKKIKKWYQFCPLPERWAWYAICWRYGIASLVNDSNRFLVRKPSLYDGAKLVPFGYQNSSHITNF